MDVTDVVTGFLRNAGEVLLLRRSDAVGSYQGMWGAVAGHAEGEPDAAIAQEIREETGLDPDDHCSLVRAGEPFAVEDSERGTRWRVYPYLFDCRTRSVEPNWETSEFTWTTPTDIRRRQTVPKLWTSYDVVRPRVETIESDTHHGSAYLSIRALEVLRDECAILAAGETTPFDSPPSVARTLLDARPSMTVIANRIHRVLSRADEDDPSAVARLAQNVIETSIAADGRAASRAAQEIDGAVVATLSRSGTVLAALREETPELVVIPESRPGREGIAAAESLAEQTDVVLTSDAGLAHQVAVQDVDIVLVGADTITAAGDVLNKVGTRALAAAASQQGCRVLVVAASDKIRPPDDDETVDLEPRDPTGLYAGTAAITVEDPTFDLTPAHLVDGIVTEDGVEETTAIRQRAIEHNQNQSWLDS